MNPRDAEKIDFLFDAIEGAIEQVYLECFNAKSRLAALKAQVAPLLADDNQPPPPPPEL